MKTLNNPTQNFNPRSPWGERLMIFLLRLFLMAFQSTLPVGGATFVVQVRASKDCISIHAPRGGSDWVPMQIAYFHPYFNPRSPWGERLGLPKVPETLSHFNPRSPWGERLQRYTNFKVHLWQRGRIFAFLREERRDSHRAAALRDRFFDGNLGANLPAFSVCYGFAVRESRCPPAYSCSCSQNAPPSFHTGCPDSKTAASPFRHP